MLQANSLKKQTLLQIVPDVIETRQPLVDEDRATKLVLTRLTEFVESLEDEYLNIEAWSIFNAWLDCHFNPTSENLSIFRSWQFFHWNPDPATVKHPLFSDKTPTIASVYMKSVTTQLSAEELGVLESAERQRIDIYEVIGIQADYVTLYGIIGKSKVVVFNTDISAKARIGEFLLANVLPVDSLRYVFLGVSQLLPRLCGNAIGEFKKFTERCEQGLPREFKTFESDALNLFYDLTHD